ncbi:MAG: TonB-dependent receptor domain-containing protein, partial [Sphingobacterium sp.]
AEGQKGWYRVRNNENHGGTRGELTDDDKLQNGQQFYFYRIKARILQKLSAEASVGLNLNSIAFDRQLPVETDTRGDIDFGSSWMPRIGLSYQATSEFALRASISRGYSTPSIAEVRSSDNQINRELKAETGTNYEVGFRVENHNRRVIADFSAYSFQMNDGIVRQLNQQGNEFFINAGKMDQKGLEASVLGQLISAPENPVLQGAIVSTNLTYQDYKFEDYQVDENDFSGNRVTSVPEWIWANTLSLNFAKGFDLNILHNYTSSIPLNDANTVESESYHLLQAKASWTGDLLDKHRVQLFFGVDNLLDETYSLGNDINAMGNRYFNPAAPRNYYAGMKFML